MFYRSSVDNLEYNLAVNHLGPFLLTNLLLARCRPGAHVVNLTCGAFRSAKAGINFEQLKAPDKEEWESLSYAESKLCNILTTRELHKRLTSAGLTVLTIRQANSCELCPVRGRGD